MKNCSAHEREMKRFCKINVIVKDEVEWQHLASAADTICIPLGNWKDGNNLLN